jgi:hypothetical protein
MLHWRNMAWEPVPTTINEAVDRIYTDLAEKDREFILSNDSAAIHFTTGMAIRNKWGLWKPDSALRRFSAIHYGIAHADDISGLILEMVWAKVRGQNYDWRAYRDRVNKHWLETMGKTALEAGGFTMPTPGIDYGADNNIKEEPRWTTAEKAGWGVAIFFFLVVAYCLSWLYFNIYRAGGGH